MKLPSHWIRSVYHLEELDSVVYFLGRERGLCSWLWHKISPWEAILVLDESPCWHQPGMLYESTIWSYLQVSYILLREAYIANTRNESVTLGDSDKCNSFIISSSHTRQWVNHVVSQATPFAKRGRVWSCCNYQVVAEERNYWPLRLGNKMLTSTKHMMYCTPWQQMQSAKRIWLVTSSFCSGDNSMVAVWPDPSSLCEGYGL